jgi:hypothetical protein
MSPWKFSKHSGISAPMKSCPSQPCSTHIPPYFLEPETLYPETPVHSLCKTATCVLTDRPYPKKNACPNSSCHKTLFFLPAASQKQACTLTLSNSEPGSSTGFSPPPSSSCHSNPPDGICCHGVGKGQIILSEDQ